MPLRPSILKGVEAMIGVNKVAKLMSEKEDFLSIEDSSGRLRINSNSSSSIISINNLVSGIVAAFKGSIDERGLFTVKDYIFYQPEYTLNVELKQRITKLGNSSIDQIINNSRKGNEMILFISGLLFGTSNDSDGKLSLSRHLLLNFIKGKLSTNESLYQLSGMISKVVIAGNSLESPENTEQVERGSFSKKDINSNVYNQILSNYDQLDGFLNELSRYIPVDLMSGQSDNVSSYFPSMSLNHIMLPENKATINKTLHLVTNPYYFTHNELSYMGTSGENIHSIFQATNYEEGLQIMEKTLDWGNIAPSAPDIQRCYSFKEIDPLIIKKMPNVYFCGNQKKYETSLYQCKGLPIRLLAIPDFSTNYSVALLDTVTLDTCELKFEYINE